MKTLSSLKNPLIAQARALSSAKERASQNAFLLDGEHMVGEGLCWYPQGIQTLFVEEGKAANYATLLNQAPAACEVYEVPEHVLAAVSQVKTSQGIAAVCTLPPFRNLNEMGSRLILLENVQDPGNVGTVLRTLDAAGFDGCILSSGCADPFGPKTLRATMGSAFRVPMCKTENVAQTISQLRKNGYAVIGAALNGSPFYEREKMPDKLCVLIGNEGQGLTTEAIGACTHLFKLPMRGHAESLNAAVAAAIFMYDLMNRP